MYCQQFTVVDLETTGLDPKKDKIIEIGAIRVVDGKITEKYECFVNPGCRLGEKVQELTGIRDQDLADAPYIGDVIGEFIRFAGEHPLLGHRILFDYSFLKRAAVNAGFPFQRQGIDTLKIARCCLPELPSKSLPALCEYFGIAYQPHRACEDARATFLVYEKLCELRKEEMADCFKVADLIYRIKKESPVTKKQLEQIRKILDSHQLTERYIDPASPEYLDFTKMTRNEASRFIDGILFRFGRFPREPEGSSFS
ncbi:MAG: 3'-5' exonuclease [Lachnospiraceae bacterium]|nr:3'-5' exonuclease [Lachnospiraceae bacterium]